MSDERKDWVDDVMDECIANEWVSEKIAEWIKEQIRSHAPTPPPVPSDVRELAETLVMCSTALSTLSKVEATTLHLKSFLYADRQKRDAETVRVLENALIPLQVVKQQNCGLGEHFSSAVESLTTHLQKLKGKA